MEPHRIARFAVALLATVVSLSCAHAQQPQPVAAQPQQAPVAKKPNVLLILVDDLGFSDLGSYGGEIGTPNLDALAKDGLRYTQFYTSARCCPSRASLMTGLQPHRAGIGSFTTARPDPNRSEAYTGHLLDTNITIPELLKKSGYSTWMVGKWHLGTPGPIERGFENYYGFKNYEAHSEGQWNPALYVRLPEDKKPEVEVARGEYYATDAFNAYAMEFLKQARSEPGKPWFLYLAHSSPHFPLQAPKADIDRNIETYRKGWDVLRAERFERMKKLGLIAKDATLPPRSLVPVDRPDIANGYGGKPNPAWDELPAERREDLARRMATYAAMVQHIDAGVGQIVNDLKAHGEFENTLILFMSDNGACYEWGPFGFDQASRAGITKLHTGDELARMGQRNTYTSGGSGWAMLSNTPLNMYKHFTHEGGLASPLLVHYPAGIANTDRWVEDPSALMDVLPTIAQLAGAAYPTEFDGRTIKPVEGVSLAPTFGGEKLAERSIPFDHQGAYALRKGDWKIVRGKRTGQPATWQLFNIATDRMEQHDVAAEHPDKVEAMKQEWMTWAKDVGIDLSITEGG